MMQNTSGPSFSSAPLAGVPLAPRVPMFRGFKRMEIQSDPEDMQKDTEEELLAVKAKVESQMKQANEPRSAIDRKLQEIEEEFRARQRRKKRQLPPPEPEPEESRQEPVKMAPQRAHRPTQQMILALPVLAMNGPQPEQPQSRMPFARNPKGPQISQGPAPFAMASSGISVSSMTAGRSGPSMSAGLSSGPGGGGAGGPR